MLEWRVAAFAILAKHTDCRPGLLRGDSQSWLQHRSPLWRGFFVWNLRSSAGMGWVTDGLVQRRIRAMKTSNVWAPILPTPPVVTLGPDPRALYFCAEDGVESGRLQGPRLATPMSDLGSVPATAKKISPRPIPPLSSSSSLPRWADCSELCGRSWLGAGSLQGLPARWATLRRAINRGHDSRRNPVSFDPSRRANLSGGEI